MSGVCLYGSYARGDFNDDSDVDLLLLLRGDVRPPEESRNLSPLVSEVSLRHDLLITVFPVPEGWFHARGTPLFENVRREGVLL